MGEGRPAATDISAIVYFTALTPVLVYLLRENCIVALSASHFYHKCPFRVEWKWLVFVAGENS
jgi:hypothetical protein